MSYLANIRQTRQTWGRHALGLFAAVWLNLAMQPCAMAAEAEEDHNCPHCPPAQTHEHGNMHGGMDHNMPCADGASDCTIDEDWNHDTRGAKLKLKDAPGDMPIAIAPREIESAITRSSDTTPRSCYSPLQAGKPPPLHILYCVYLD